MPNVPEEYVQDIVRRVTAEVLKELQAQQSGTFQVGDLQKHVDTFGKRHMAWKINYETIASEEVQEE
jgi:hypothetical protein